MPKGEPSLPAVSKARPAVAKAKVGGGRPAGSTAVRAGQKAPPRPAGAARAPALVGGWDVTYESEEASLFYISADGLVTLSKHDGSGIAWLEKTLTADADAGWAFRIQGHRRAGVHELLKLNEGKLVLVQWTGEDWLNGSGSRVTNQADPRLKQLRFERLQMTKVAPKASTTPAAAAAKLAAAAAQARAARARPQVAKVASIGKAKAAAQHTQASPGTAGMGTEASAPAKVGGIRPSLRIPAVPAKAAVRRPTPEPVVSAPSKSAGRPRPALPKARTELKRDDIMGAARDRLGENLLSQEDHAKIGAFKADLGLPQEAELALKLLDQNALRRFFAAKEHWRTIEASPDPCDALLAIVGRLDPRAEEIVRNVVSLERGDKPKPGPPGNAPGPLPKPAVPRPQGAADPRPTMPNRPRPHAPATSSTGTPAPDTASAEPQEVAKFFDREGDTSTITLEDGKLMWFAPALGKKQVENLTIREEGGKLSIVGPFGVAKVVNPPMNSAPRKQMLEKIKTFCRDLKVPLQEESRSPVRLPRGQDDRPRRRSEERRPHRPRSRSRRRSPRREDRRDDRHRDDRPRDGRREEHGRGRDRRDNGERRSARGRSRSRSRKRPERPERRSRSRRREEDKRGRGADNDRQDRKPEPRRPEAGRPEAGRPEAGRPEAKREDERRAARPAERHDRPPPPGPPGPPGPPAPPPVRAPAPPPPRLPNPCNLPPPPGNNATSEDELAQWVSGLDSAGTLRKYLPVIRQEFGSLPELASAVIDVPGGGKSVLSCIEPTLFQTLGIESLGHRLMLAKGLVALNGQMQAG